MSDTPQRRPDGRLSRWWAGTTTGLPRPFWYLLAGAFVNRLGYMVEPFLALYLAGPRELDPSTVGVVLAAFGAGAFASQPIGGYLADRYGRRATLVGGMIGTAASFMLLASVRGLGLIGVAACVSGVAIDLYRPAVSAMIADLVAPENRAKAFALLYWAINLGVAAAGITGGFLATRSYWLLFTVDAATCLAFALLIAQRVPETRPERQPGDQAGYGRALRRTAGDPHRGHAARRDRVHAELHHVAAGGSRRRPRPRRLWSHLRGEPGGGDPGPGAGSAGDRPAAGCAHPRRLGDRDGHRIRADDVRVVGAVVHGHGHRVDPRRDWLQRGRPRPGRRHRAACTSRPVQRHRRHVVWRRCVRGAVGRHGSSRELRRAPYGPAA
ncbi:MAG TPA: MFS transporter [Jiangellaceae bacterium]|nr:MFS transporter [Jiangellaceae bacterium]